MKNVRSYDLNQGSPKNFHVLQLSYLDRSRTKDVLVEHTINLGYVFFTLWYVESRTIMSSLLKSQ
jgi:hypothetical protein